MFNFEVHSRYLSRPDRYDNYQIYQLGAGFPAQFVHPVVVKTYFFHTIGNESFHFIFWEGEFPKLVYTFKS